MNRPTVFEVGSAQTLSQLLKPAVRYVLAWYAQGNHLGSMQVARVVANRFDALFAVVMAVLESLSLMRRGGSMAESFYALKRSKVGGWAWFASIMDVVGAQALADTLEHEYNQRISQRDSLFVRVYPYMDLAVKSVYSAYLLAYMFGRTNSTTPINHLFGIVISRWAEQDYKAFADEKSAPLFLPATSSGAKASRIARASHTLSAILQKSTSLASTYVIPAAIFGFRFMEWWYASEYHKLAQSQEPIPPPPESMMPSPDGIPLPSDPSLCPLCVSEVKNPALLPSGYVYCYTCIYKHVEKHNECPVSKLRVVGGGASVRKLYSMG
ncbi:ubiquitin-protein ligase peroxin 12 [Chytriomyces hyalinus]|nr:ubiquitin-protein ligase peroxin 12 [Chytriomyces hyalinus]